MARYDYRCPACGTQFEVEHPMTEHPEVRCPECNEVATQVFSASGIVFKGSGFYNTDQRKGSTSATSATSSSSSASGGSSAEGSSGKGASEASGSSQTSGAGGSSKAADSGSSDS